MANNQRERMLIIATLCVFGLFAADRFVVEPMMANWKDRSAQIAELQQKITKGEALIDRKNDLRDRWREMQERSLPGDQAAAENEVLAATNDWARTSGLNVSDLKPRWGQDDDLGEYFEVRVEASGTLAAVTRFLYELERDPMAVRLHDYEIQARDERGQQLSLTARLTGVITKGKQS